VRQSDSLALSIAGVTCRLEFAPGYELLAEARDRYKGFIHEGDCDVLFRVEHPEDRTPPSYPGTGWARRDGNEIVFGRNDVEARWGEKRATVTATVVDNPFSLDALLRMFFSLYAVWKHGVMLHSAGLARDGVGYLFVGRSESGKSTLARLATGFEHLTDELTVVLPRGQGFVICGTPFWGLFQKGGANRAVPLARVFHLVRDDRTFLRELPMRASVRQLFGCTMNFLVDGDWHERIMGTLVRLAAETRPPELHCVPDDRVWDLLL
jgi:hypothetical protein